MTVVFFVVLLLGNACFVAAEFSLVSARRSALETMAESGSGGARMALRGMESVTLMLAGAQLGITLCSVGLGALAEPAIERLLVPLAGAAHLPHTAADAVAFVIALAVVVLLHVVLGELVPKNFALAAPERAATVFGAGLVGVVAVLRPVLWVVNGLANLSVRLLGITPKSEVTSAFTPEEVSGMIAESRLGGLLEEEEEALLARALRFSEEQVGTLAKPISAMVTVPAGATPADVEALSAETGFSRFPVTAADGSLTGYIHLKDVLETDPGRRAAAVRPGSFRRLATVTATDGLSDAVATMQRSRAHLALVVGADGAAAAVVALEDVVSRLVSSGTEPLASRVGSPAEPATS